VDVVVTSPPLLAPATPEIALLLHRLEGLVRQLAESPEPEPWGGVVRFGDVEIEPATQTIHRGGSAVAVTRTEFRILFALMRRAGATVTRDELRGAVWGPDAPIRSRVIDTHIARLRRKLEADPTRPRHIITALNLGYRFQQ
jgi:DNA-binding response OmpR family regulator